MENSLAALYIPIAASMSIGKNKNLMSNIKSQLSNAVNNLNIKINNFNMTKFTTNLSKTSSSAVNAAQAVAVLSMILQNKSVKSGVLLDLFFNTYSSIINSKIAGWGYRTLSDFRNSLKNGTFNVNSSLFLSDFSEAFDLINSPTNTNTLSSRYGKELSFDVVEKCEFDVKNNIADYKINSQITRWVADVEPIEIKLVVHINNVDGDLTYTDDYIRKISDCMANKTGVTLRIGKNIYEDCIVSCFNPVIVNVYEFQLNIILKYFYYSGLYQRTVVGGVVVNPKPCTVIEKLLNGNKNAGICM